MNWWQHVLVALVACLAVAQYSNISITPALALIVVAGALAPDVDHHKAKAFRIVIAAIAAATVFFSFEFLKTRFELIYAIAGGIAAAVLAVSIARVLKPRHRGITHSLAAVIAFAAVAFAVAGKQEIALIGGLAYFTHLAADLEIKVI